MEIKAGKTEWAEYKQDSRRSTKMPGEEAGPGTALIFCCSAGDSQGPSWDSRRHPAGPADWFPLVPMGPAPRVPWQQSACVEARDARGWAAIPRDSEEGLKAWAPRLNESAWQAVLPWKEKRAGSNSRMAASPGG